VSTNECVAVAVLYPWRWISIAIWVAVLIVVAVQSVALYAGLPRHCVDVRADGAGLRPRRPGRPGSRGSTPRPADASQRLAPPGSAARAEPEPGPVLAKPEETR
jgi:hypothetical protein